MLSTSWRNGTRLLASLFSEDKIVLLNTTVPSKPTLIWVRAPREPRVLALPVRTYAATVRVRSWGPPHALRQRTSDAPAPPP